MADSVKPLAVYLETGKRTTMAGAIEWPGWCRGARSEEAALEALIAYGPRYESVLRAAGIEFEAPEERSALEVVERLKGTGTTDFGVPDIAPSSDSEPVDEGDLSRLKGLLEACWAAFDRAVAVAEGKELRKGPRGGGRELAGVVGHVVGAEASYLKRLGGQPPSDKVEEEPDRTNQEQRRIILETLGAVARGEIARQGPRGSVRWTARYFVRRAAWHVLDHVWEIEDRVL
jgi:hypothetical protein